MNWLLLRGFAREARHWGEFPALLRAHLAGGHVLTVDLPGVGTEHQRPSPASIRAIVDDVRPRFLHARESCDPSARWSVLGVSLSGMIALEWAAMFPTELARVVAVNTSSLDSGLPLERFSPNGLRTIAASLGDRSLESRERRTLDLTVNDRRLDRDALVKEWVAIAERAPLSPANAAAQLVAASRWSAPRRLDTPALLLASRGDRLVSPRCSRRIAERLGASLAVHPWAGHDLPRDDARWVLRQLDAFAAVSPNDESPSEESPSDGTCVHRVGECTRSAGRADNAC